MTEADAKAKQEIAAAIEETRAMLDCIARIDRLLFARLMNLECFHKQICRRMTAEYWNRYKTIGIG
jgi:hypothetical protein